MKRGDKKLSASNGKLTRREEIFVDEYLVDLNATRACKAAGYSEHSAGALAVQLLAKPLIATAIQAAIDSRKQRLRIDADWVLQKLVMHEARIDAMNNARIEDIYNADGTLKPIADWPELWHQACMIKGLKVTELFEFEDVEVTGEDGKPVISKNGKPKRVKERRLIGYLKEVQRNDYIKEQRETLHTIGLHVGVGAFKESPNSGPREIKISVKYEEHHHGNAQAAAGEIIDIKPNGNGTTH